MTGNHARGVPPVEQGLHALAAAGAALHGHLVHPHPHETVGHRGVHPPREAQGVVQGLPTVGQRVAHRVPHEDGQPRHERGPEVPTHRIPPQGQWQARLLLPPRTQVQDLVQGVVAERELALVDDEAHIDPALPHLLQDPVEGDHAGRDSGGEEF